MLFKAIGQTLKFHFGATRKIPTLWDHNATVYWQLSNALVGAYSNIQFGVLIRDNIDVITDHQVAFALQRINELDLDADTDFYEYVLPTLKEFVPNITRDHTTSLATIVATCGKLNVKDQSLWQLFEQKIVSERLYRYIPLKDLLYLTQQVSKSDYGSEQFFKTLEQQIVRHRLALSEEDIRLTNQAFERKKIVAPIVQQLQEGAQKQLA